MSKSTGIGVLMEMKVNRPLPDDSAIQNESIVTISVRGISQDFRVMHIADDRQTIRLMAFRGTEIEPED